MATMEAESTGGVAGRSPGNSGHGPAPRQLLRRVLLGSDGDRVRRGLMNLLWVAALTALVLLEKVGPAGPITARLVGLGLAGWGGWLLAGALV